MLDHWNLTLVMGTFDLSCELSHTIFFNDYSCLQEPLVIEQLAIAQWVISTLNHYGFACKDKNVVGLLWN